MHALSAAVPPDPALSLQEQERELVDIYSVVTPDLFIVDALKGEKGFQPHAQDCLLGAVDAVALDAVLALWPARTCPTWIASIWLPSTAWASASPAASPCMATI